MRESWGCSDKSGKCGGCTALARRRRGEAARQCGKTHGQVEMRQIENGSRVTWRCPRWYWRWLPSHFCCAATPRNGTRWRASLARLSTALPRQRPRFLQIRYIPLLIAAPPRGLISVLQTTPCLGGAARRPGPARKRQIHPCRPRAGDFWSARWRSTTLKNV